MALWTDSKDPFPLTGPILLKKYITRSQIKGVGLNEKIKKGVKD